MGTQALTLLKISDPTEIQEMQFPYMVKGFHLTPEKNFLLWDEQSVQLTEINYSSNSPTTIKTISSFNVANVIKATYNAGQLYAFANDELMIYTVQVRLNFDPFCNCKTLGNSKEENKFPRNRRQARSNCHERD